MLRRLILASMATLATALVATPTASAAATYTLTDLGNLGYPSAYAFGINATGQVVGRSYLAQTISTTPCPPRHTCKTHPAHAIRYSAGTLTDLGTLGGIYAEARAVNGAGDVAGYSKLANGTYNAFLVHNGTMTDIGTLVAGGSSEAYGINTFGEVVGYASAATDYHAFLYSGGKMTDLGDLGGGYSAASGINNSHQVVGSSDNAGGYSNAFVDSGGKMTNLGTLGGIQSAAYAINDSGQIVGWAQTASEATHAFLYTGGRMTDLGAYNIDTVAEAINSSGVIVGQTYGVDSSGLPFYHAFIYSAGAFHDLNGLIPAGSGFELTDATAINDSGQIACNGYNSSNGQTHAFLLTPS